MIDLSVLLASCRALLVTLVGLEVRRAGRRHRAAQHARGYSAEQ